MQSANYPFLRKKKLELFSLIIFLADNHYTSA